MPIPEVTLKTYEKTRVDLAIDKFANLENPTIADLNRVWVEADIQYKVDEYRLGSLQMTEKQAREELHRSDRLAEFMGTANDPRPNDYCHCHAIIAGAHREAAALRAVMAWCKMRIDDPRNGCWLPKNMKARQHMPSWLRQAVPHSRIHRDSYYRWLRQIINFTRIKSSDDLVRTLKMVRLRLQSGTVPRDILDEMGL